MEKKKNTKSTSKKKTAPVKKEKVTVKKETVKEEKVVVKEEPKKCKCNKKLIILIASIALIVILLIISLVIFFNKKNVTTRLVKTMGKDYYSEYLHKSLSNGRSKKDVEIILDKYKERGIRVNLINLSNLFDGKYKKDIEKLEKKNIKCNEKTTKAVIYPKKPFGKNDYKIKVELDCEY